MSEPSHGDEGRFLTLDHLVVIAPSLEIGNAYVRARLGAQPVAGGQHRELGTHNALLRLGDDVFLEVIALDPAATAHRGHRVFGIETVDGVWEDWRRDLRLRHFVARAESLDRLLAAHGSLLGEARRVTRRERAWRMSIPPGGGLPGEGLTPTAVQYEPGMIPARHMPESGCRLLEVVVEHPEPEGLERLYRDLDLRGSWRLAEGPRPRLRARVATPRGEATLD